MKDYTGKSIFVGMDVHKKTYSVTAICDGTIVKRDTLKAEPQGLLPTLKSDLAREKLRLLMKRDFAAFIYIEL